MFASHFRGDEISYCFERLLSRSSVHNFDASYLLNLGDTVEDYCDMDILFIYLIWFLFFWPSVCWHEIFHKYLFLIKMEYSGTLKIVRARSA